MDATPMDTGDADHETHAGSSSAPEARTGAPSNPGAGWRRRSATGSDARPTMAAAAPSQRQRALSLFRAILRTGRKWANETERPYILNEARQLFHANAKLQDSAEIETKLTEAQHRLELGVHYKIPYPRAFYVAPDNVGKTKKRRGYAVNPTYLDSYHQHMPAPPTPQPTNPHG